MRSLPLHSSAARLSGIDDRDDTVVLVTFQQPARRLLPAKYDTNKIDIIDCITSRRIASSSNSHHVNLRSSTAIAQLERTIQDILEGRRRNSGGVTVVLDSVDELADKGVHCVVRILSRLLGMLGERKDSTYSRNDERCSLLISLRRFKACHTTPCIVPHTSFFPVFVHRPIPPLDSSLPFVIPHDDPPYAASLTTHRAPLTRVRPLHPALHHRIARPSYHFIPPILHRERMGFALRSAEKLQRGGRAYSA